MWLDRTLLSLRDRLESDIMKACTSEEAVRACGAFSTLLAIENMAEVEAADEAAKLRESREMLTHGPSTQRN